MTTCGITRRGSSDVVQGEKRNNGNIPGKPGDDSPLQGSLAGMGNGEELLR